MTRGQPERVGSSRGREVSGIVVLGLALFIGLSVGSLQLGSGTLMGPCGATVGLAMYALVGLGAYLLAIGLGLAAIRSLSGRPFKLGSLETGAALGGALAMAMLLHLAVGKYRLRGYAAGGLVGEYGAELLVSLVGRVGAVLVGTTTLAVALVLSTPLSVRALGGQVSTAVRAGLGLLARGVAMIFPERHEEEEEEEEPEEVVAPERAARASRSKGRHADDTVTDHVLDVSEDDVAEARPAAIRKRVKRLDEAERARLKEAVAAFQSESTAAPEATVVVEDLQAVEPAPATAARSAAAPQIVEPKIVAPTVAKAPEAPPAHKPDYIPAAGGYHLPELSLLDTEDTEPDELDRNAMLALADRLQKTLADYGVKGNVVQIHPGPVVTMYEFVPAAGTKLSKITGLSNDLAMSLQALRVRIVAPIPGKGSVGIEVPNKSRATVFLKEILADEHVQKAKSKLSLGLGKDIAGTPVAVDLAKMPHLLVAGTTGSGKSVAVNGMICSILFHANPEEVRMIMIDPKMVELSIYEGIPHLLLPVVTDPKKANLALKWAVDEMERRYELVSKAGVRDLVSYNKKVEKVLADGPPKLAEKKIKIYVDDEQGGKTELEVAPDEAAVAAAGGTVTEEVREEISAARALVQKCAQDAGPPPRKLPYIVVVIDEFADLMMVAPKDVETSVARIAQKARAVGIHLMLATQRPSVDVITGLIKANFPSRIAFQVASKIDSRTILDQQGAENLLGQGDMLFTDRGQAIRRVHGALVTDVEIKRLVDFLKEQGKPVYDMDILKPRGEDEDGESLDLGEDPGDEMYDLAVKLVCETRMASVSMIQRRLQIGFNRASRLVERMEREGIVGSANGSKPREVLAQAI